MEQTIETDGDGHKMIDGYYVEDDRYDESDLETPAEWHNLGDANPEIHGGNFIKWVDNMDMWHIVVTIHKEDLPRDMMDEESHLVQNMWIDPQDVWVNGNPEEGFSEGLLWDVNQLSYGPETTWDMDVVMQSIAVGLPMYRHYDHQDDRISEDTDYWEYLAEEFDIPNPDESDEVGFY